MHTILIVDDEPNYQIVLGEFLKDEGFETMTADNGQQALDLVKNNDINLVITDMQMPGMDGFALLQAIKEFSGTIPVIMITAYGEVEKAVRAMQLGAFNYLTKPFNTEELLACANKAIEHYSLAQENQRLQKEISKRYRFDQLIGKNKSMLQLYNLIERVAPTQSTVLITGESGTGKELVARAIHYNSTRNTAPFISVNCAALPEALLESEFFGHERGAFTGAVAMRKGKFEAADTGTIFLDEIGDMPLSLQAKLLRVIQEKTFERIGANKTIQVDVRIVAATNKDLKDEVAQGTFREDLYYRLNVIHLPLPPLRERQDDIPILAEHFVRKYASQSGRPNLTIAQQTLRFLTTLPWDGNVRELENTIERATVLCQGPVIEPEDVQPLSGVVSSSEENYVNLNLDLIPDDAKLTDVLNEIEGKMLNRALEETNFVQTQAAKKLGITKSLLQYKMKKFQIKRSDG
ncbi:MAG: sigma-54-dependent Fis family transcriptional regulator [Desulfobulbaceae bacterium]|nr:sigma-54-dependent Fis family transcriptional regulator [Desulfobulbaceae bacterium]